MAGHSQTTKNLIRLSRLEGDEDFIQEYLRVNSNATRQDALQSKFGYMSLDENESYNSSSGKKNSGGGGLGFIEKMLSTQEQNVPGDAGEFLTAQKGIDAFFDANGKFKGILKSIGGIITDQIVIGLQQSTDLLGEMNTAAGMTGELSREFRQEIMAASPDVIRLGISFDELKNSVSTVLTESGKFKLLGQETIEELARTSVFTKSMEDLAGMSKGFEDIGLGVSDMTREIDAAGHSALELGLNAKSVTSGINENLSKINQYGFKNGVEGLSKMVEQSIEFRMSMDSVFAVADKVWSPEGALEMVSNLQVIGGAIGDLNDPIKLMYMATNDVEGLQEAIHGAAKELVTYNSEQGKFEVTGANLRKAKEMADTLGISMGELTKTAVAGMERTQAASELMSRGFNMDDEQIEFLTNIAQMKDGKMTIEVPEDLQKQLGSNVELSSITREQTNALLENQELFKTMSTEDIARQQFTAIQNIEHDMSYITAKARVGIGKELGDGIEKFLSSSPGKSISDLSYEGFNKMAKGLDADLDWVSKVINDSPVVKPYFDKKTSGTINGEATSPNIPTEQKTETTTTTTEEKSNITHRFEHTFKADNITEPIKRSIFNDPNIQNNFKNSYLESLNVI